LGAVANSIASSLVGLSNLSSSSYSQAATCNLNNTLFVGNLHASLQEIDLIQVFRPFGRIVECCKKWLHFGFVKFTTEEEACHAYVTLNGFRLKGRPMRLEFQNRTKKARIKAILAQAALQAAANNYPLSNDVQLGSMSSLSSLGSLGSLGGGSGANSLGNYSGVINSPDDIVNNQLSHQQMKNNASLYNNANEAATYAAFYKNDTVAAPEAAGTTAPINTFFNPDQLIKFAKGSEPVDSIKDTSSSTYSSFNLDIESDFKDFKELERNILLNGEKIADVDDLIEMHTAFPSKSLSSKSDQIKSKTSSSDEIMLTLTKKALSPSSNSPHYDCLSVSSDSGCRSASFLNDEDSAIASLKSIEHFSRHLKMKESEKQPKQSLQIESDLTISEHCEYTCSNSSPVKEAKSNNNNSMVLDLVEIENDAAKDNEDDHEAKNDGEDNDDEDDDDDECVSNCDTSDDASEIPTDSDCLNELDLIEEFPLESDCDSACSTTTSDECLELNRFNQVIDKEGNMTRKKLDYGIYRSINQTLSLFIEPNDILKQMDASEYDEYNLFPSDDASSAALADSYLLSKQHPFYLF